MKTYRFTVNRLYPFLLSLILIPCYGQDENKKKKSLGERFSNMTGKLMTQKAEGLSGLDLQATIISGLYDMRTETSEAKYFPAGTIDGDHAVSLTFTKSSGVLMVDLQGEVRCDSEKIKPVGLGTFLGVLPDASENPRRISITAANGDAAEFLLQPVPEIEIVSINGQSIMPTIDLSEDLIVAFINPPGYEHTKISVGLLTDFMGTRTINFFADGPSEPGYIKIPKESFHDATVSGKLGAGQFNKGKNFLILRRQHYLTNEQLGPEQRKGKLGSVTLESLAYASMPVVVKGKKVEEEVLTDLSFAGKFGSGKIGFEIHKPNALKGIPFSRASRFGLGTLVVNGTIFEIKTETYSGVFDLEDFSGWSYTRYTKVKTITTVSKFPQLPTEHWDYLLGKFYARLSSLLQSKYNIAFAEVDQVTSTKDYKLLFPIEEVDDEVKVTRGYQQTRRMNPAKLGQSPTLLTTPTNGKSPLQRIMDEAEVDGLVSVEIDFKVGMNRKKEVVLVPRVMLSIRGIDETLGDRYGVYAEGRMSVKDGVPYNEAELRNDPEVLFKVLNADLIIECIDYMIGNLKKRELELGFEEIWVRGGK